MKKARNPYLSLVLALLIFSVSCTQDNAVITGEKSFDDSTFQEFKNYSLEVEFSSDIKKIESVREKTNEMIAVINSQYETELVLQDELIDLGGLDEYEMINQNLKNGIFSEKDVELLKSIESDLATNDFATAINNFENKVFELALDSYEIERYNDFSNMLKLVNNSDSIIFNNFQQKGCLTAILAHSLATISLSSCGTGVLCPIAIAAWLVSYYNVIDACGDR